MADLDRTQVILVINGGKNFRGVDLSGLNLSGLDLSKANLTNTNFSGADLTNVNFSESDLTNAIFNDIKKDGESQFCKIEGCDFTNAVLDGTRFIQKISRTRYYTSQYDSHTTDSDIEKEYISLPSGSRGYIRDLKQFGAYVANHEKEYITKPYEPPPPKKWRGFFG